MVALAVACLAYAPALPDGVLSLRTFTTRSIDGPDPSAGLNCDATTSTSITLTHSFYAAAGGAVWEYTGAFVMLQGGTTYKSLTLTGVTAKPRYGQPPSSATAILSLAPSAMAPPDTFSFSVSGNREKGQTACPNNMCLAPTPAKVPKPGPPTCGFFDPVSGISQTVTGANTSVTFDLSALAQFPPSATFQLFVTPTGPVPNNPSFWEAGVSASAVSAGH